MVKYVAICYAFGVMRHIYHIHDTHQAILTSSKNDVTMYCWNEEDEVKVAFNLNFKTLSKSWFIRALFYNIVEHELVY